MARAGRRWDATNRHHRWRAWGREVSVSPSGRGSAQRLGFLVLRGSGYYETPPLLPVLTAIAPLIDQARNGRRPDLADDDVEALNVLTEAGIDRPADDDPGRRRTDDTQRYLAASRLLLGAARSRPILLAIDDAHALDDASAALIAHLTAAAVHQSEALPVRLLTQLAIRPGAGRPVARRTVGRLRAEQGGAELLLEGLDEVDLNELLASLGPAPPSRPLLRTIGRRTGGNPLFARLLWTHLLETGATVTKGDSVVLSDPAAVETAHVGLDEVVDERVDALRQACRDLLAVAAVLGTEGDIDVLAAITSQTREHVEDLLSEADEAGVCRVEGNRYRFDHPLLVASLGRAFTARTAPAIAPRHRDDDDRTHPAPCPRHRGPPAARPGRWRRPRRRRKWGVAAAERAMDLGAWGDAVASFALALDDDGRRVRARRADGAVHTRQHGRVPPTTISRAASASVSQPWPWPGSSTTSRPGPRRCPSWAIRACGWPKAAPLRLLRSSNSS